jgi:son of sevenless
LSTNFSFLKFSTIYLSDLAFIDEGNPDTLSCGLINFAKQQLVYGSLQEIILFQQHGYEIERKDPLCSTLVALPYLDEQALYNLSLHREPRVPKTQA